MDRGGKDVFPKICLALTLLYWGFTGNSLPAQLPPYLQTPSLHFYRRENFINLPKLGYAISRDILPIGALMWDYPDGSEVEADIHSSQFGLRQRNRALKAL